jgi:hypothetical protein
MTQSGNILIDFTKWVFKWLAIILVGLLALGFASIGGWWTWNWWSYERHKKQIDVVAINSAAPASGPKVVVERDGKTAEAMCAGSEFPIFVGFINKSSRTIESLVIEVNARLPEHSTNILTYGSRVEMDRIIEPGAGYGSCWRFSVRDEYRTDPQITKAIYSGKINFVRFKDD